MLQTWQGSNQESPDHQSDAHPTEPPRPTHRDLTGQNNTSMLIKAIQNNFIIQETWVSADCIGQNVGFYLERYVFYPILNCLRKTLKNKQSKQNVVANTEIFF